MSDALYRLGHDLMDAAQGPLQFRVLMQAVVALGFGWRDGVGDDRRALRPPYGIWVSLGKVFLAVLAMDVACQAIVLGFGALEIGLAIALLAALPLYLATRGAVALALRSQRRTPRRAP